MRVVSPYRPFAPESREHLALGAFDWVDALQMLRVSVERACHCECVALTDNLTTLPGPMLQYPTEERRLMWWILEVSLRYLESDAFDRDTVFCSPDSLVFCDLRQWFAGDFGIVVRPDHRARPILNALQWWPVAAKARLIDLYRQALAMAHGLPDELVVWGADSEPFRRLLKPLWAGCGPRKSGIVANLVDSRQVMRPLTSEVIEQLQQGRPIDPPAAVLDFRFLRKRFMRAYFDATLGAAVSA